MTINPKDLLIQYYNQSTDITNLTVSRQVRSVIDFVLSRISSNKGVFTVLVTLALYKILHPSQDIRQHKIELPNGFSGRSFDTVYVTPTLKELGLPSMAESGWLTRSLEQAYPYDENFNGKITPVELKNSFLAVVAFIETGPLNAEIALKILLNGAINYRLQNQIQIERVASTEVEISRIITLLKEHFEQRYPTHGGSKLPVIAFYALYTLMTKQLLRFKDMVLLPLGSHTASDRTSRSAGDIEVTYQGRIYEAVEVKLDKPVNAQILNVAYEKINKFGVMRYYILSGAENSHLDQIEVETIVNRIKNEHGCIVIVNGLYQSIKYYLRLLSSPNEFLNLYIHLVENDTELQICHKEKLVSLLDMF
jgi:DNA (cytosine-5)-methyltransferase 1